MFRSYPHSVSGPIHSCAHQIELLLESDTVWKSNFFLSLAGVVLREPKLQHGNLRWAMSRLQYLAEIDRSGSLINDSRISRYK